MRGRRGAAGPRGAAAPRGAAGPRGRSDREEGLSARTRQQQAAERLSKPVLPPSVAQQQSPEISVRSPNALSRERSRERSEERDGELAGGESAGWQQLLELEARLGNVHATNTSLRSRLNGFDSDGEESDEQDASPLSAPLWRRSPFGSGAPAVDIDVRQMANQLDELGSIHAEGWDHLQSGPAGQQLSTYLELFEKEDMPEPAALVGSDRAWLLNKYGELRYKHRELFVRCELAGEENRSCARENDRLQRQVESLQRQLADTRNITADQSSMLRTCQEQLTMGEAQSTYVTTTSPWLIAAEVTPSAPGSAR